MKRKLLITSLICVITEIILGTIFYFLIINDKTTITSYSDAFLLVVQIAIAAIVLFIISNLATLFMLKIGQEKRLIFFQIFFLCGSIIGIIFYIINSFSDYFCFLGIIFLVPVAITCFFWLRIMKLGT